MKTKVFNKKSTSQKYKTSSCNSKIDSKEFHDNHLKNYAFLKSSKYPMLILQDILHTNTSISLQYPLSVHKMEIVRNRNNNLEIPISKELSCSKPEEMKLPVKKKATRRQKRIVDLPKNRRRKNNETLVNKNNNIANQEEECRLVPGITNITTDMKNRFKLRECSVHLVRCTFKRSSNNPDGKGFIAENSESKAHTVLSIKQVNGTDESLLGENNCSADISSTKDISCSDKNSKPMHKCSTETKKSSKKIKRSVSGSVAARAKRKLPQLIDNCVLPKNAFDFTSIERKRLSVDTLITFNKNIKQKHFADAKQSHTKNTKEPNSNIETFTNQMINSPMKINGQTESTQIICNRSMPLIDEPITDNETNNNTEIKQYFAHNLLNNENSLRTDSHKFHSFKSNSSTCTYVETTRTENITDEDSQIDNAISDFLSSCMRNRASQRTVNTEQTHSNNNETGKLWSHQNDVQQSTELTDDRIAIPIHTTENASPKISTDRNIATLEECKEINKTERLNSGEPVGVLSLTTNNLEKFNVIASNSETTSYAEKYVKSLQKTETDAKNTNIEKQGENKQRSTAIASRKRCWAQNTTKSSETANKKNIKLDRSNWKKRKLTESTLNNPQNTSNDTCHISNLSKPNASSVNENRKPISVRTGKSATSKTLVIKPTTIGNLSAEPKQHSFNSEDQSRGKTIVNASNSSTQLSMTEVCQYVTKNEDSASKEKVTSNNKAENNVDSDDDDCISILCNSDVINDLAKDVEDGIAGLADTHTSNEEYVLTNHTWNNYVQNNKREAEEDLKRFPVSNIPSGITFTKKPIVLSPKIIKTQPVTENVTITKDSPKENQAPSLPTKPAVSKTNVKSRLGYEVTDKREQNIPMTPHKFFYGRCFQKMQHGLCYRRNCTFNHNLNLEMLSLREKGYEYIHAMMEIAVRSEYRYFVQNLYTDLLKNLEPTHILDLYTLIHNAKFLSNNCVLKTIDSLIEKGKSIEEIVNLLTILFDKNAISTFYWVILKHVEKQIVLGKWWKTLRKLFITFIPPVSYVRLVIQECLSVQENEALIKDVAVNLINKLSIGHAQAPELRDILPQFLKLYNRITRGPENSSSVHLPAVQDDKPSSINNDKLVTTLQNVNVDDKTTTRIKKSEQYVFQLLNHTDQDTVDKAEPLFDPPCTSTLESPINSLSSTVRLDIFESERSNIPSNESTQIECCCTNNSPYVTDVPWVLHSIDNLQPSQSMYHHRFWKFNIDLKSLREGIRHRDYEHVLHILEKYSGHQNNFHLNGCYNILRNNIMSSDEHLANIVKISVKTGMSSNLEETLFTIGKYVLTELADNGSWVLAYKLLKILQIYESRFNAGFILLSAEIYLANGRPLKALELLRQTNLIFTNRQRWKVPSENRDEDLRVMIITLVLESLCDNFVENAYALYDTLLGDQYCIYFPIDLPRCIDKLTLALLTAGKHDLVIELARLLIPFNLMLRPNVFRAVVTTATTHDIKLAKQLFQYGVKLGAYQAIKLNTPPICLMVNTSWTEEEMYLAVTQLIQQLVMEIGHAIDHMGFKQLAVYAFFEIVPSSKELELSEFRKFDNRSIIKSSRQMMEKILHTRFNPPLAFVASYKERFVKFSSKKLLDYLSSTHVSL